MGRKRSSHEISQSARPLDPDQGEELKRSGEPASVPLDSQRPSAAAASIDVDEKVKEPPKAAGGDTGVKAGSKDGGGGDDGDAKAERKDGGGGDDGGDGDGDDDDDEDRHDFDDDSEEDEVEPAPAKRARRGPAPEEAPQPAEKTVSAKVIKRYHLEAMTADSPEVMRAAAGGKLSWETPIKDIETHAKWVRRQIKDKLPAALAAQKAIHGWDVDDDDVELMLEDRAAPGVRILSPEKLAIVATFIRDIEAYCEYKVMMGWSGENLIEDPIRLMTERAEASARAYVRSVKAAAAALKLQTAALKPIKE